jgi:hypothetical protein
MGSDLAAGKVIERPSREGDTARARRSVGGTLWPGGGPAYSAAGGSVTSPSGSSRISPSRR